MNYKLLTMCALSLLCHDTKAMGEIYNDSLNYRVEAAASVATEGVTPLWLSSNKYGLASLQPTSGYVRVEVQQPTFQFGKSSSWKLGYGADLVVPVNYATENTMRGKQRTNFIVQQLYADVDYKWLRLSAGAKERPMELKHQALSSGSQTLGINARPVPALRLELPEYVSLTGKENPWIAIKGHFGYGIMTDGAWQKAYVPANGLRAENALLHTKAGYLRIGNPKKFPLVFEGGLEMATQFGGTIYNPIGREGRFGETLEMGQGPKDFLNAIFGLGSDATDEMYGNAAGNTLGSWLFSLTYHAKDWSVRAYYDHYFEDHSMMFFQYGWLDGMVGLEVNLPKNPVASTLVYEYITTTYQSGPVYHDHTAAIPDQVSGIDNYYNHNLYQGWQHWGQSIGNPLFTSPLYRKDGTLTFSGNRFKAHHIGICGTPLPRLNYRLLYTYMSNWGTYAAPYEDIRYSNSLLCELNYELPTTSKWWGDGWKIGAAFALDSGKCIGNNTGFLFTLSKSGLLAH